MPPTSQSRNAARLGAALPNQNAEAFRACHQRFEECLEFCDIQSASPLMEAAGSFVLDFDITARRAIGANANRYRLFQLHFVGNTGRAECCSKLKLNHWTFASEVKVIQEVVGRAFTEAGLFPLAPYFSPTAELGKLAA